MDTDLMDTVLKSEVPTTKALLPVADVSREPLFLPEVRAFAGPTTRALSTARFTAPLLVFAWLLALATQGALAAPLVVAGAGVALSSSAVLELWVGARRRRLVKTAAHLVAYTRRMLGDEHELTRRAVVARDLLTGHVGNDPSVSTRAEEILRYTLELARRRELGPRGA